MSEQPDRLYNLLPRFYRQTDIERGGPLLALLRVIAEQVDVVEKDIDQLYENWFIETCQDWVVPYVGDLIGYRPVHEAGEPGEVTTLEGKLRNKILIPRREVADTIRYRRRKGTLALLEQLADDVAGWPARAVEFYTLLGQTENINYRRLDRGRTVDLRRGNELDKLGTPFEKLAHTVDVRRITSHHTPGFFNIPSVGLFVWRLKTYSVTHSPAYCLEQGGPHRYTFSVLGNDSPLYTHPVPETEPTQIAGELNLPIPIRRRAFKEHKTDYYGEGKSLQIWVGVRQPPERPGQEKRRRRAESHHEGEPHQAVIVQRLVEPERIIVADLSDWQYRPHHDQVAVDPELGRIAFPGDHLPAGVWVSYYYAFSADIGSGEYNRPILQPVDHTTYLVGEGEEHATIQAALDQWELDKNKEEEQEEGKVQKDEKGSHAQLLNAVIEITDNRDYTELLDISLEEKESLQIRASNYTRPMLHLLDWRTNLPDPIRVTGETGSRFTLDGLLISGRGLVAQGNLAEVCIRHCTLVPGWEIRGHCEPQGPEEASIELLDMSTLLTIEHSIVGSIAVTQEEARMDPVQIHISDSILDATSPTLYALAGLDNFIAPAVLAIKRSTVIGNIHVHAIELAENCIFNGQVRVAHRQQGCMRFCSITPDSRTPRRYNCLPDLVEQAVDEDKSILGNAEKDKIKERERHRVQPLFNDVRYGKPTYCQLAEACAEEIKRGADDESEMGVFHDLYQPQRDANLRARLDEYTPAGMEAGIIYAS